jgi:PDZ domain-containing protein
VSLPIEADNAAPRKRRRWIRPSDILVALLIVVIVGGVLELIPADEYMLLPGEAKAVQPMISVHGYPPPHSRGGLYMTDVNLYKVNHLLEELYGKLNPQADLEKAQDVSGGLSDAQYQKLNAQLMADSINKAEAAALSVAKGYKSHFSPNGPEVSLIVSGTPAAKVLRIGDFISYIDGRRVRLATDVPPLIRRLTPGQYVHLTVIRRGLLRRFVIKTIPSTAGRPTPNGKTPLVGIAVRDVLVFPIKISINAGDIGGPSAGLMFSLGIIERIEKRDVTHGCKVAGTGTIDYNGAVGAIGGAKQKILAARNAGIQYFLVPDVPEDRNPAQQNHGSITVVPVRTLGQALAFLNTLKPCSR